MVDSDSNISNDIPIDNLEIVEENIIHERPSNKSTFWGFYKDLLGDDFEQMKERATTPLPVTFRLVETNYLYKNFLEKFSNCSKENSDFEIIDWFKSQAYRIEKGVRKDDSLFTKIRDWIVIGERSGALVRQEEVSMVPVALLDIKPGEIVLDICAAPGSKTTQIAEVLKTTGVVVANDVNWSRTHLLAHRLAPVGSTGVIVSNFDAKFMSRTAFDNEEFYFDSILVDAPCTGDGTMRKNMRVPHVWRLSKARTLHKTQIEILLRAIAQTKPGGKILYSTCSMNPIENEAVIVAILRQCPEVTLSKNTPRVLSHKLGLTSWSVPTEGNILKARYLSERYLQIYLIRRQICRIFAYIAYASKKDPLFKEEYESGACYDYIKLPYQKPNKKGKKKTQGVPDEAREAARIKLENIISCMRENYKKTNLWYNTLESFLDCACPWLNDFVRPDALKALAKGCDVVTTSHMQASNWHTEDELDNIIQTVIGKPRPVIELDETSAWPIAFRESEEESNKYLTNFYNNKKISEKVPAKNLLYATNYYSIVKTLQSKGYMFSVEDLTYIDQLHSKVPILKGEHADAIKAIYGGLISEDINEWLKRTEWEEGTPVKLTDDQYRWLYLDQFFENSLDAFKGQPIYRTVANHLDTPFLQDLVIPISTLYLYVHPEQELTKEIDSMNLELCKRFYPGINNCGGFFCALLEKSSTWPVKTITKKLNYRIGDDFEFVRDIDLTADYTELPDNICEICQIGSDNSEARSTVSQRQKLTPLNERGPILQSCKEALIAFGLPDELINRCVIRKESASKVYLLSEEAIKYMESKVAICSAGLRLLTRMQSATDIQWRVAQEAINIFISSSCKRMIDVSEDLFKTLLKSRDYFFKKVKETESNDNKKSTSSKEFINPENMTYDEFLNFSGASSLYYSENKLSTGGALLRLNRGDNIEPLVMSVLLSSNKITQMLPEEDRIAMGFTVFGYSTEELEITKSVPESLKIVSPKKRKSSISSLVSQAKKCYSYIKSACNNIL